MELSPKDVSFLSLIAEYPTAFSDLIKHIESKYARRIALAIVHDVGSPRQRKAGKFFRDWAEGNADWKRKR